MGYCMSQRDCEFVIKAENIPAVLAAIKAMYATEDEVDGNGLPDVSPQFSWVDRTIVLKAETLEQALEEWRWEIDFGLNGDVIRINFSGEKIGSDGDLFSNIAPFVEHGSYIEMIGEDDERWRWVFWRGEAREEYPVITWPYENITAVGELLEGIKHE